MSSCFTGDNMGGEYDEKRNRRQEAAPSWWRVATKTIIGPVLVATLPVAGYAVVSWRDDLRALNLNFRDLVGDFEHVVEWQGVHDNLHRTSDAKYLQTKTQEVVTQYQVGECQKELSKIDEQVRILSSSLNNLQERAVDKR